MICSSGRHDRRPARPSAPPMKTTTGTDNRRTDHSGSNGDGPVAARTSSRVGWWHPNGKPPTSDPDSLCAAIEDFRRSVLLVLTTAGLAVTVGGSCTFEPSSNGDEGFPVAAFLPQVRVADLGDPRFCADHGLRYPYVAGTMANGIGSADIVEAMGRAGMLGFYGAAGQSLAVVEAAIQRVT